VIYGEKAVLLQRILKHAKNETSYIISDSHARDINNLFLIVVFLYISNLAGSQSRKAFIR